jgi:carbonic anhydrase
MLKLNSLFLLTAVFAVLANPATSNAAPKQGANWGYHGDLGPQNWGKLDAEYSLCSTGKKQSPVNISNATLTNHSVLKTHYMATAAQAVYDSTTQLNIHGEKTIINDGHTLQINMPANNDNEYITINDDKYQLIQFHFHTPSENLINGKNFPVEIHFVNQGANGNLAVVGVMIKQGKYNQALEELLNELPSKKQALKVSNKLLVDVNNLLPTDKLYYNFTGSLTTPPCSEDVQWFVFATPVEASKLQINQLKTLLPTDNARPVQKLNGRDIMQALIK